MNHKINKFLTSVCCPLGGDAAGFCLVVVQSSSFISKFNDLDFPQLNSCSKAHQSMR